MYISNVQANNEWQDVTELVKAKNNDVSFAFASGTTYHVTNNNGDVYLANIDAEPSEKNGVGRLLPSGQTYVFKPISSLKLWVISLSGSSELCIEEEETAS